MGDQPDFSNLKAIFINCTLKQSPRKSNTQGLIDVSKAIMRNEGVNIDEIRMADHEVAFGSSPDMTELGVDTDEWPTLFKRIFDADILIIGTPIWLGQISSVCKLLIERLDAMSGQQNEKGQYLYYGKTGGCLITGNEDGAKHVAMEILFALQHIGYSIPPQADSGWLGEIGPGPSYLDEGSGGPEHEFTNRNTTFLTYNLLHLAKMLKDFGGYPPYGNSAKQWNNGERWKFENPNLK